MTTAALLWIAAAALGITCLAAISARALAEFSPAELEEICRKWNKPDRLGHILRWREQVGLAMQSLRTLALAAAAATRQHRRSGNTAGRSILPSAAWAPALLAALLAGAGRQSLAALDLRPAVGRSILVLRLAGCCGARASCWCRWRCWRTSSTWPCTAWPAAT